MKGEATYKGLRIPGSGVGSLDSDWASDFNLLSLSFLISKMERITVPVPEGYVWLQPSQSSLSSLPGLEGNSPL